MKKGFLTFAAALLCSMSAFAQDGSTETQTVGVLIENHALVAVTDADLEFDFSSQTPTTAGAAFTLGATPVATAYLHYSMMLSDGANDNATISVALTDLQPGLELSLLIDDITAGSTNGGTLGGVHADFDAAGVNGTGSGTPNTNNVLGSTATTIINGIGSSYTGTGSTDGYKMTYTMAISDYAALDAETLSGNQGTITYTIAE